MSYKDIVNTILKDQAAYNSYLKPQSSLCCGSCAMNSLLGDPVTRSIVLTLLNGWLMASANESTTKRDKFFYYTAAGLSNLFIFKY